MSELKLPPTLTPAQLELLANAAERAGFQSVDLKAAISTAREMAAKGGAIGCRDVPDSASSSLVGGLVGFGLGLLLGAGQPDSSRREPTSDEPPRSNSTVH